MEKFFAYWNFFLTNQETRKQVKTFADRLYSMDGDTLSMMADQSKEDSNAFDRLCQHFEKNIVLYVGNSKDAKNKYDLFRRSLDLLSRIEAFQPQDETQKFDTTEIIKLATEENGNHYRYYKYLLDSIKTRNIATHINPRQLHFEVICNKDFPANKIGEENAISNDLLEAATPENGSSTACVAKCVDFLRELAAYQKAKNAPTNYCSPKVIEDALTRYFVKDQQQIVLSTAMILFMQEQSDLEDNQSEESTQKNVDAMINKFLDRGGCTKQAKSILTELRPHVTPKDKFIARVVFEYFTKKKAGYIEALEILMDPNGLDIMNHQKIDGLSAEDLAILHDGCREKLSFDKSTPIDEKSLEMAEQFMTGYNNYYKENYDKAHLPAMAYQELFGKDVLSLTIVPPLQENIVQGYKSGQEPCKDKMQFFMESAIKLLLQQNSADVGIYNLTQVIAAESLFRDNAQDQTRKNAPSICSLAYDTLIAYDESLNTPAPNAKDKRITGIDGQMLSKAATIKLFGAYVQIISDKVEEILYAPAMQKEAQRRIQASYQELANNQG